MKNNLYEINYVWRNGSMLLDGRAFCVAESKDEAIEKLDIHVRKYCDNSYIKRIIRISEAENTIFVIE